LEKLDFASVGGVVSGSVYCIKLDKFEMKHNNGSLKKSKRCKFDFSESQHLK